MRRHAAWYTKGLRKSAQLRLQFNQAVNRQDFLAILQVLEGRTELAKEVKIYEYAGRMPVANSVLPRPHGGRIVGDVLEEQGGKILSEVGEGNDVFVCPWLVDSQSVYRSGIITRLMDIQSQMLTDEDGVQMSVLLASFEGQAHARWHTLQTNGHCVVSSDIELMNFKRMRKEYPAISGAGWMPSGGYTEFIGKTDIPVTIYGTDLENGREVSVTANLGGLVEKEQAHTINTLSSGRYQHMDCVRRGL